MSFHAPLKLVSVICVLVMSTLGGTYVHAPTTPAKLSTTPGSSTPRSSNKTQFVSSNWNVECQPDAIARRMLCELSYTVKVAKSGQLFTRIAIGAAPHQIVLQLPHGLNLKAGVQLQVDENLPVSLAFTTSNQLGIFASSLISDALLASMQKGAKMKLMISAQDGKKIIIPISLIGFSLAVEKLG